MKNPIVKLSLAIVFTGILGVSIASASTFTDVGPTDWFYTYVEQLAAAGVLDITADNFRPTDVINRAEVAKLVVNGMGLILETPTKAPFKDVALGEWYTPYIYTAQKNNILSGYQDGSGTPTGYFGPSDPVTREQAIKIVILGAGMSIVIKDGPHFTDVPTSRWSYQFVESGYQWSILEGYADNTFKPENNINRAEFAKILAGAIVPPFRQTSTQQTSTQQPATTQQSSSL